MSLDLKCVLRSLFQSRGFSLAVIVTLGLGIGANTAIFSAVRGVLLRPLPHRDGDRLMYLRQSAEAKGSDNIAFSVPEINDFRQASGTLAQIAEYSPLTLNLVEDGGASQVQVGLVTANYLDVMGLVPIAGQGFTPRDDGPTAAPVIVLTRDYWLDHFGGDPKIVGRTLRIGGRTAPVVGVLQAAPFFPQKIDALMNMSISEHHVSATMIQGRSHRMTEMIARLAPGATVEQARAEVATITTRVHAEHPGIYDAASRYTVTLTPFKEVLGEDAQLTLWLLMGVAAFVLVIACANVANLTLMRGIRRQQEMVVRASLGATRANLRRLLLLEHLILALAGGALGIAIAFASTALLETFASRMSNRAGDIHVDGVVLGFTLAVTVLVAVLLSWPVRLGRERHLGSELTAGSTRTTGSGRRRRLQQALVVTQVGVSVMLLTGAGLLVQSMQRLAAVDPGLDSRNVLTMEVPADFAALTSRDLAIRQYERMAAELTTIPGVKIVGLGSTVPLRVSQFQLDIKADGRVLQPGEPQPQAEFRTADPGYFRASGMTVVAGRDFTTADNETGQRVVIVNQTVARLLFPGEDPVGRRLTWTGEVLKFIGLEETWMTIVGVVRDTKDGGLDAAPTRTIYTPFRQGVFPTGSLILRTDVDPRGVARAAREVVRSVDPTQPVEKLMPLDDIRDESVGPRRTNALLIGGFSALALVIAAIGIAAVLAFSVSARTNEIGIRMSLGAGPGLIQRMILREGGGLLALGLTAGVLGAVLTTQFIQGLLYEVAPHDPGTLVAVSAIMASIGLAACWIPARRAARINPVRAIRGE